MVNYAYNSAGQALTAIDGNSTQYVSNSTYWPSGAEFQSWMPNIYISRGLNSRLQTTFLYSDNGQVENFYMYKSYDHNDGHNNGNVMSVTNHKDTNRTQTFTYDPLNRITSGWSMAGSGAFSWGENYTIDAWGNLQMAPMAGKTQGGNFQHASDEKNHAAGLSYDAAGNLTGYTTPGQYVYDFENRMQSTAGTTYAYDADGERVLKSTGSAPAKMYWSAGGNILAESDGTGNLTSEYVYFGGKRTARIDLPANTVHYYLSDHLNSTSQVVNSAGMIEEESDYSPFGTEIVVTGPGTNHYKFTGKERDSESGLDYFGARYYSNSMGRFVTPDWSTTPVPVPYADLTDPQSLNQYTYVRNIPTTRFDADGHDGWETFKTLVSLGVAVANAGSEIIRSDIKRYMDTHSPPHYGPPGMPYPQVPAGTPCWCNPSGGTNSGDNKNQNNSQSSNAQEQGRDAQGRFTSKQPDQSQPGSAAEKKGLDSVGAVKNTEKLNGTIRDGTIPETGQHVEVKSGASVNDTKQLRNMGQAAMDATGKPLKVVTTDPNVKVSKPAQRNENLEFEHKPQQ